MPVGAGPASECPSVIPQRHLNNDEQFNPKPFDGRFYAAIGDHMGERYLDWGFTKGTVHEVDFIEKILRLGREARILDVGCGVGRHSVELARRGYRPVGVDISARFIQIAQDAARREDLSAEFIVADARQLELQCEFDAAICLCEGGFGLAGSDEGHLAMLRGIAKALKPGAPFVLNAINAYSAVRRAAPNFDVYSCTSRETETVNNANGEKITADIYTSAFTFRELKLMLAMSGMETEAGFGCTAGRFAMKPLTVDDMEIMIVARRPAAG
jgi:2-polyprenyl-3-methyl-5-hydroxy-6-metoxy-1,4-benzoquinol methylase